MMITKNLIKFGSILIKIPKAMKGVWDKSENRWGYKKNGH
ncbi:hypothetical protein [uncultured Mediterranean phage uvMED]|nr:hypothetical protein [uncultured Mediterranean phage uvMED]